MVLVLSYVEPGLSCGKFLFGSGFLNCVSTIVLDKLVGFGGLVCKLCGVWTEIEPGNSFINDFGIDL